MSVVDSTGVDNEQQPQQQPAQHPADPFAHVPSIWVEGVELVQAPRFHARLPAEETTQESAA